MVVRSLIILLCLSVLSAVCLEQNDAVENNLGHWQVRHLRPTHNTLLNNTIIPRPTAAPSSTMTMIPGHNITQTWCYNVTNTMTFAQCTITTVYIPLTSTMVPQPATTKSHASPNKPTHRPSSTRKHSKNHHHTITKKHSSNHHHTTTHRATTTKKHSSKKPVPTTRHHTTTKKHSSKKPVPTSHQHTTTKKHSSSKHHHTTASHHPSSRHTTITGHQSRQTHSPATTHQGTHQTPAAVGTSSESTTPTTDSTDAMTTTQEPTATTDLVPTLTATTESVAINPSTSTNGNATSTTMSATSTATSDDVLSPAVANDVANRNLGIGLGVGVGGVAALGLAGLLFYNHRAKNQSSSSMSEEEAINTRWRTQSFMGVVASVVAKLPRSGSLRSKLSTSSSPGMAYTTNTPPDPQMSDAYQHRY